MRYMGTITAPMVVPSARRFTDSAIGTGMAALVSELEKRDPLLREPLSSITYPRDIPVIVGGGDWHDTVSAMGIDYGVAGGSGDGVIAASGSDEMKMIQVNLMDEKWKAHEFATGIRIKWTDLQRALITGRSLDEMHSEGVRKAYDKHMDQNTYIGFESIGTSGIVNNPGVAATTVAPSGTGGSMRWSAKTADQILDDVNLAISAVWEAAEFDEEALPDHIILPHAQFTMLATKKVSEAADKSVLKYLLENNIASLRGRSMGIYGCPWCKGAGTGGTDRMVVYVNSERFLVEQELAPLRKTMTNPNATYRSYDTAYQANIGEVQIFYSQTIGYFDGI